MKNKQLQITILRPGGNDTALISGLFNSADRKLINDIVMKKFSKVEQVGFYELSPSTNTATLEMAGGEFCGNAVRSLAYLALKGRKSDVYIKSSGTDQILPAGMLNKNTAYAQMPIRKNFSSVSRINNTLYQVELDGITQLITSTPDQKFENNLKELGKQLLEDNNLLYSSPAAGVMYISIKEEQIVLDPVVWVRDIQTLFYETACASGTTAVGMYLAKYKNTSNKFISVIQPSDSKLEIKVTTNKQIITNAIINGPVEFLQQISMEVAL